MLRKKVVDGAPRAATAAAGRAQSRAPEEIRSHPDRYNMAETSRHRSSADRQRYDGESACEEVPDCTHGAYGTQRRGLGEGYGHGHCES